MVATLYWKKKVIKKWEDEGHKWYNIQVLWQCNYDLSLISNTSNQQRADRFLDLEDDIDSLHLLIEVFLGYNLSWSKQKLDQEKRIIALKDMTRLFEFVIVQEKNMRKDHHLIVIFIANKW